MTDVAAPMRRPATTVVWKSDVEQRRDESARLFSGIAAAFNQFIHSAVDAAAPRCIEARLTPYAARHELQTVGR